MANRLSNWFHHRKDNLGNKEHAIALEDVQPQHPDEYPARHLKEILDRRRSDLSEVMAQPTGMLDPLT